MLKTSKGNFIRNPLLGRGWTGCTRGQICDSDPLLFWSGIAKWVCWRCFIINHVAKWVSSIVKAQISLYKANMSRLKVDPQASSPCLSLGPIKGWYLETFWAPRVGGGGCGISSYLLELRDQTLWLSCQGKSKELETQKPHCRNDQYQAKQAKKSKVKQSQASNQNKTQTETKRKQKQDSTITKTKKQVLNTTQRNKKQPIWRPKGPRPWLPQMRSQQRSHRGISLRSAHGLELDHLRGWSPPPPPKSTVCHSGFLEKHFLLGEVDGLRTWRSHFKNDIFGAGLDPRGQLLHRCTIWFF